MHPRHVLALLLILSGASFAQDTNFSAGPQYLVTTPSTLFLRPIATPSLSLGEVPPAAGFRPEEQAVAQEAPAPSAVTNGTFLSDVYWGDHPAGEVDARRVTTPSLSVPETPTSLISSEASPISGPLPGLTSESIGTSHVIEVSSTTLPTNLPASIFDTGVTAIADAQSLHERGYGVPLGDVATYWKAHKSGIVRVLTNRDVQRLHGTGS